MRKTIKWYVAIATCAGLLACGTFLAVRFNDYLKANDQGICWLEGRKVPMDEMRIRALKTYALAQKIKFDQSNDEMEHRFSYWRIIKQDYDGATLLKLSLNFSLPRSERIDMHKEIFDPILKVEDFDQDLLYSDAFYVDIIKNNYMLATSYDSGFGGIFFRTSSYRLYKQDEFDKSIILPRNLTDRMHGFGLYYFSIQGINADYWNYQTNKSIEIGNTSYAVNNCGNSLYLASGSVQTINEDGEKPILTGNQTHRTMQPERSLLTAFIEFFQGI